MAVCIVDTGIAITPDTPPDNPNGPILRRIAIDGESGEPQGTGFEYMHGTRMAYAAIAPQNDWGTVGVWPGGVAIGVRASVDHQANFVQSAYQQGVRMCLQQKDFSLGVIELALSCHSCEPSQEDLELLNDTIGLAHKQEVSVVVAAGNAPGAAGFPATVQGAIAVTEGDASGGVCSRAASEPATELLVAPGCPTSSADPLTGRPQLLDDGGTSSASASVAGLLSFIRSSRPDVGYAQIEDWLRTSSRVVGGRRVIDGAAAAHLAGLGDAYKRAKHRQAGSPSPLTPQPSPPAISTGLPAPTPVATPGTPKIRVRHDRLDAPTGATVRWRGKSLTVKLRRRTRATFFRVTAQMPGGETRRTTRKWRRFTWRLSLRPRGLKIVALSTTDFGPRPSRPVRYLLGRDGAYRQADSPGSRRARRT